MMNKEEVDLLVKKWSKTGLLDGLKHSQSDKSMAILLVSPPSMLVTPKEKPDDMDN